MLLTILHRPYYHDDYIQRCVHQTSCIPSSTAKTTPIREANLNHELYSANFDVADDEGLVEGDGGEPAEVAADEGVDEEGGVEPAEVAADSDVAVPLFVQPSVSH